MCSSDLDLANCYYSGYCHLIISFITSWSINIDLTLKNIIIADKQLYRQTVPDLGGGKVGILAPGTFGIRALLCVDNPHTNNM